MTNEKTFLTNCTLIKMPESDCVSRVTHVIFDLDGTLIDSEKFLLKANNDILKNYGKSVDWKVKSKTNGVDMPKASKIIVDHFDLPLSAKEYLDRVLARFQAYLIGRVNGEEHVELMPGAERLVQHLDKHQIPMALCTGGEKESYQYKVKPFGDFFNPGNYFHHIVLGSSDPEIEPNQNKPHPMPYLVCMKRFDQKPLKPSQVLVFEDSTAGLTAASKACCSTVFVSENDLDPMKLGPIKPNLHIKSLLDFRPEIFGLPPFDNETDYDQ